MTKEIFYINTDGGSRGNPGPAGVGVAIFSADEKLIKSTHKFLGRMTNNEAEYQGAILGLKFFKASFGAPVAKNSKIILRMDSELVVKQLNGQYQIKEEKLHPLFIQIHNLRVSEFPNLEIVHVRREENKKADELANEAMDGGQQGKLV